MFWLKRLVLAAVLASIFAVGVGGTFTCEYNDDDDKNDRPPPPP